MVNNLNSSHPAYPRRKIIDITIALFITFGLFLLASWLVLNRIETDLIKVSVSNTRNQAYVITSDTSTDARLTKYNGDSVGTLKKYIFDGDSNSPFANSPFYVADTAAVKDFLTNDLDKVPANKIPVLAPTDGFTITDEGEQFDWLRREIVNKYYIAGYAPVSFGFGRPILIDDGSNKIDDYISALTKDWRGDLDADLEDKWTDTDRPYRLDKYTVAKFDEPKDLLNYSAITFDELFNSRQPLYITSFIGDAYDVAATFRMARIILFIMIIACIPVCLVTATVIVYFHEIMTEHNHSSTK